MRKRSRWLPLYWLPLLFLACTKKTPTAAPGEFLLNATPDQILQQASEALLADGFSIDSIDRTEHTVQSSWKGVGLEDLASIASLSDNPDRYQEGQLRYTVTISETTEGCRLAIKAEIQGNFVARQGESNNFGATGRWQPERSRGVAEQRLFDRISNK